MPQRNGQRSSKGRAATARRVLMGGASPTNGIMPSIKVMTAQGNLITTSYFGGPKKGGIAPNATAFNRANTHTISPGMGKTNYLFTFKTSYGPKPFGPYLV
tara:strand:+ start:539 stop:841 length:303 start_codon:yes stop_codon:yes gene_type:complete